jgi:hypothetical protein
MRARIAAATLFTLALTATAHGQGRTDVVTLNNADHITGEIVRLERGRLEFKTDDAGTLYLEWDKLASLVTQRVVEVVTTDGRQFVGSLAPAARRSLAVADPGNTTSALTLPMMDVALITPIGRSFWRKLDGAFDVGFNYTRSSGVAQLNLNSDTVYRKPAFEGRLTASATLTKNDDGSGGDDRGSVELSYLRYPWRRWLVSAATRFENNESLGIRLRSQVGGTFGPRLVNNHRGLLAFGAGLVFNDERGIDVEPDRNVEALLAARGSFYTYDRPRTNLDVSVQYYPSLSDAGRQRVQLDAGAKRELWKDLFVALTVYHTFDSRPPNPDANRNDVGVVASIGWTY